MYCKGCGIPMIYSNGNCYCEKCGFKTISVCPQCGSTALDYDRVKGVAICAVCHEVTILPKESDKPANPVPESPFYSETFDLPDSGTHVFSSGTIRAELKPRYDLIPHSPLQRLALTYTEGAKKYGDNNWRNGGKDFLQDVPNHIIDHIYEWLSGNRSEDHPR